MATTTDPSPPIAMRLLALLPAALLVAVASSARAQRNLDFGDRGSTISGGGRSEPRGGGPDRGRDPKPAAPAPPPAPPAPVATPATPPAAVPPVPPTAEEQFKTLAEANWQFTMEAFKASAKRMAIALGIAAARGINANPFVFAAKEFVRPTPTVDAKTETEHYKAAVAEYKRRLEAEQKLNAEIAKKKVIP